MNFQETGTDGADAGGDGMPDNPFTDTPNADTGGTQPASSPIDRLFDGSAPGPATQELEADYGMSKHQAVLGRGIMRTATGDGIPPIFEILFGGGMWFLSIKRSESSVISSGDGGDDSDEMNGLPSAPPEEM